jgi:hypothetical protein
MLRSLKQRLIEGPAGPALLAARTKIFWATIRLRQPRYDGKVFCIGFNKTGTTSCGKAFGLLGLRNSSFNTRVWRDYFQHGRIKQVLDYTARFDSCDDLPWLRQEMIPVLDSVFPGSRFVYLTRDIATWEHSYAEWTRLMTGRVPDMVRAREAFCNHRDFVEHYFARRVGVDFLSLEIKDPYGLRKLAAFLGKEAPSNAFPHLNRTADFATQRGRAS